MKQKPPKVAVAAVLMAMVCLVSFPLPSFAQSRSFREGGPVKQNKGAKKIRFLYEASRFYLAGATALDMTSTVRALDHPTVARREDGSFLADYHGTENGWARFLGQRNTAGVVLANVALNEGLQLLSRDLYRKGGRWRILAIVVNLAKGTGNLVAGIHNLRYNQTVDGRVRAATGYRGLIIWSH